MVIFADPGDAFVNVPFLSWGFVMGCTVGVDPAFGCGYMSLFGNVIWWAFVFCFSDIAGHFLYPHCTAVHGCLVHFKVSHNMCCGTIILTVDNVIFVWIFFCVMLDIYKQVCVSMCFSLDKALHSAGISSGFIIFGTNLTNPLNELLLALQPVSLFSSLMTKRRLPPITFIVTLN